MFRQFVFLTEVLGTINVSAVVFVFKSTVDDVFLVIQMIILAVENINQGSISDTRQTVGLIGLSKVGNLQRRRVIHVHHRLQATRGVVVLVLFGIHNIPRMLKHAVRPAELAWAASRACARLSDIETHRSGLRSTQQRVRHGPSMGR